MAVRTDNALIFGAVSVLQPVDVVSLAGLRSWIWAWLPRATLGPSFGNASEIERRGVVQRAAQAAARARE